MFCLFWDILYTSYRSYSETIVFYVYGALVGKIWRKQDARLAGSTSTYRITLPGPHWMLATVRRIFTLPFPELILYREKVTRPAFSIAIFFRYKPVAAKHALENTRMWTLRNLVERVTTWLKRARTEWWQGGGRKWCAIATEKFSTLMPCITMHYGTRDATWRSRRHFSVETSLKISHSRRRLN